MRFRPLILMLFLPLFVADSLLAQPKDLGYDPPPGWEYVKNLDSLDFTMTAYNDSIFATYISVSPNSIRKLEHSTDGGKTWHPSIMPEGHQRISLYPSSIPGTNMLWNYSWDDTVETLIISTDLGVTWQNRPPMNNFVPNLPDWDLGNGNPLIKTDLHNPRTNWFIKYQKNWSNTREHGYYQNMYFSPDSGFTWKLLKIPPPSNYQNATHIDFDIKFDYRDSGAWYFTSRGRIEPHYPPYDTVTEYYISRDEGQTFTPVSIVGDFVGINERMQQFIWKKLRLGGSFDNISGYKEYQTIDSDGVENTVDLLHILQPYKNFSFVENKYSFSIGISNNQIYPRDPNQALIAVDEIKYEDIPQIKDTVYLDSSWLYFTKDWKNFQTLWQRPNRGHVRTTYLDPVEGIVYIVSVDTPITKITQNGWERQSLWKRKVFSAPKNSIPTEHVYDQVNPIIKLSWDSDLKDPKLLVSTLSSSQTRIILFDVLGREIKKLFNGYLPQGRYSFDVTKGISTSAQVLYVRFEQPNFVRTEKIIFKN